MGQTLSAMLIVVASWLALGILLAGSGALLERLLLGRPSPDASSGRRIAPPRPFVWFWLGLALTVGLVQLWNCLFPVRGPALLLVIVPGLLGLLVSRASFLQLARDLFRHPASLFAASLLCLWISNRAIGPGDNIDSGSYHYGAVRWAVEHPVVPGIINLHDRLAYNNAGLLFNALLEGSLWKGISHHLVNGLFASVMILWIARHSELLLRTRRAVHAPPVLMILPVLAIAASSNISSPTTDPLPTMLSMASLALLFEYLCPADQPSTEDHSPGILPATVIILAMLATMAKLSVATLNLPTALLTFACWRPWSKSAQRGEWITASRVVLFCALVSLTWMARGVVMSGILLFPATSIILPLDWAPARPITTLTREMVMADSHALRDPQSPLLSGFGWLRGWLRWQMSSINLALTILPLAISAVLGAAALVCAWKRRTSLGRPAITLVAVVAGLLAWFLISPTPRFATHLTWGLAGLCAGLLVRALGAGFKPPLAVLCVVGAWVVGMMPLAAIFKVRSAQPGAAARGGLFIAGAPGTGFHPTPVREGEDFVTASDLVIKIPGLLKGMFDGPIPNSQYPDRSLEERKPGNMRAGFRPSRIARPGPDQAQLERIAAHVARHWQEGDLMLMDAGAGAFAEMLHASGMPRSTAVRVMEPGVPTRQIASEVARFSRAGRCWLIFADETGDTNVDEMALTLYFADWYSTRLAQHNERSISACLCQFE